MSNSVDEAVFDYFALLLTEEDVVEDVADEAVKNTKPSIPYAAQAALAATPAKGDKELGQQQVKLVEQLQRTPVSAASKPSVATKSASSLDKRALEQLLSAVSAPPTAQIDKPIEAIQTKTKVADEAIVISKIKQTVVEPQIEEKIETSATIKVEAKAVDEQVTEQQLETQTGITPPGITESLVEQLDEEFQVLFFKVAGLTLAVPLVSLGGIVKIERVNHIMGRPEWYLGVQTHRESQLNVVNSCAWVMPEKYDDTLAQSVDYQYIVLLEDSNWGLACESLVNSVKILKSEVNWRTKAGKRPWLAGVVKEQMCGILHVQALIELLNLGLGSQDSIG
ncbi:chemotaxis protein CheW [Shewanella colwelliana]|uniref:chemotaxis protein CheW n=1 Tax=Shewanella colwelliana TaxID=23 RepID=UPI0022AFFD8E|nr:chemotaxis protein CheW [Shewanella colwelliana]MCZ4336733.1 chemotaxis protein CheW [Shewanella colwelliana]